MINGGNYIHLPIKQRISILRGKVHLLKKTFIYLKELVQKFMFNSVFLQKGILAL